ncbi:MAG: hypothetical protein LBH68_04275 [Bifidobacteriaceae bacterium]|jgi:hypothetical protein|nr:hypothetical protein [Bifidobacteriaceae bacterium]
MTRRIWATALSAVLAGGWLAGCGAPDIPAPKEPEGCGSTAELKVSDFEKLASVLPEGSAVEIEHGSPESVWITAATAEADDVREAIEAVAGALECGKGSVMVDSVQAIEVAGALGLADLNVMVSNSRAQAIDQPAFAYGLSTVPGLTGFHAFYIPINWKTVAPRPSLTSLSTPTVNAEQWDLLAAATAKFPNLETLTISIDPMGEWSWEPLRQFSKLTELNISVDYFTAIEATEVARETVDLILQAPTALPGLKTINGHDAATLTAADLGQADAKTREEMLWAKQAEENEESLEGWRQKVLDDGYATGGSTTEITGPVLVVQGSTTSIHAGAWEESWQGLPADKLCKKADDCVSLVVVGFREGASSGSYRPTGGGAVAFTGNLGETTVTIYNSRDRTMTAPIVVKTTEPPDQVSSKAEAVGPADYPAAYAWIVANTK